MDADVIVLGAGAAGLAAAQTLKHAGADVLLLEARGRIGGRAETIIDRASAVPVELGAEFIHGDAPLTTAAATARRLALHDIADDRWIRIGRQFIETKHYDARIARVLEKTLKPLRRQDHAFADLVAAAPLTAADRRLATSYVENFLAAPAGAISAQALADSGAEGTGRSRRLANGYGPLLSSIANDFADRIRLGTTATRLEWSRGRVRVATRGLTERRATWTARAAVVALPLGVLHAPAGTVGQVVFAPALDAAHARAIAGLAMGNVVKLTLRFREAFWAKADREKASLFHSATAPFPTFWTTMPVEAPMLVAWAGGSAAEALAGLDAPQLAKVAIDAFAEIVDEAPARGHALVEDCFFHDWRADPFARGAYAYALVGGAHAARGLARPLASTLFFAGEHTVSGETSGTIEGALHSGQRAARQALRALER